MDFLNPNFLDSFYATPDPIVVKRSEVRRNRTQGLDARGYPLEPGAVSDEELERQRRAVAPTER